MSAHLDIIPVVVAVGTTTVSLLLFVYNRITTRFDSQDKVASKHGKALVKMAEASKAVVTEQASTKGDLEELQEAVTELGHSVRMLKQRAAQHSDWLRLLAEAAGVDTSRSLALGPRRSQGARMDVELPETLPDPPTASS